MKKLLILAIVFSLTVVLNSVSNAQENVVPEGKFVATEIAAPEVTAATVVESESAQGCCAPVPYRPCPFRPFVRRACTPCVAAPCNPCPPCSPQPPICAPIPRKLCGAPIQPPCQVDQAVYSPCANPCADAYGYGYAGNRSPLRNFFARLFSRCHSNYEPYYGYDVPQFGYGVDCPCHCEQH
ncbi:MAG: hypothetical protein LBK82_16835 [Planctomycetaceae bacterium]|nr:hypothetical protein [Planctomycetaceae bacterium]